MARAKPKSPSFAPEEALAPFRPDIDGPWDAAAASHLARRAGFGMPEAEVQRILEQGPEVAAEGLFADVSESEGERLTAGTAMQTGSREAVQGAWLYRMLLGSNAVREKLTLFWHDHFATSVDKVEDAYLMGKQIDLFRRLGAGPFEKLMLAVAKDPAMLIWLDGNSNRRGAANENFAREVFELFCLGIGNYTERDISEAARAFTGWHVRRGRFRFIDSAHDKGEKEVLGQRGAFGGDDVVRIAVSQLACAKHIARRLYRYYVHPEPSEALVDAMASVLRDVQLNVGAFLTRLLRSRAFFSVSARLALVSSPVDFAVGTLRTLGGIASPERLSRALARMGQELLAPPSVKGWDEGLAWLRSTTLLARFRFAEDLRAGKLSARMPWDRLEDGKKLLQRLFPYGLDDAVRRRILSGGDDPKVVAVSSMQLPEYQFV